MFTQVFSYGSLPRSARAGSGFAESHAWPRDEHDDPLDAGTAGELAAGTEGGSAPERVIRLPERVLAAVAHDLRNPLNTIALTVQSMLLRDEEGRLARDLEIVARSVRRMERLVRDLLEVARLNEKSSRIERTRVDLDALSREALELVEIKARRRGIELARRIDAALPAVQGDPDQLARVLSNLLNNALKFTPQGGRVTLRAERRPDGVLVSVEDTGRGIAAEDLPHLFEPFWRGAADQPGTGLGLAICRAIVAAHGGRIWAESRPGAGAAFRFTLPLEARA